MAAYYYTGYPKVAFVTAILLLLGSASILFVMSELSDAMRYLSGVMIVVAILLIMYYMFKKW